MCAVCMVPVAASAQAAASSAGDPVAVYLTTPRDTKKLERQPDQHFGPGTGGAQVTVGVDPSQKLQAIRGFGAAFTDSSLWLLSKLSADKREQTLRSLLDPRAGIGLSVMRVPMAASDFSASGMYSYDDMPPGQSDP